VKSSRTRTLTRRRRARTLLVAGVGVVVLVLWTRPDDGGPAQDQGTAYRQTWPAEYAETTCGQFLSEMTYQQRYAAAADLLGAARTTDGGAVRPPDTLVKAYLADLDDVCAAGQTTSLARAGADLYRARGRTYRP
jgi:hypothetical protein